MAGEQKGVTLILCFLEEARKSSVFFNYYARRKKSDYNLMNL